jgi:hypothetical protein
MASAIRRLNAVNERTDEIKCGGGPKRKVVESMISPLQTLTCLGTPNGGETRKFHEKVAEVHKIAPEY